jgi:hypothetical protein
MALVLADRVKETTTSTGTTAITLAGAATGYQTFLLAIGNTNTTYYTIADQTGANWEVGIGTYTTIGNTLSRDTVLASSNAGALVVFLTGTKDVFVTYPAERALYTDGPLGTPSSGTLTNATGYTYANLSGTVPTWNQNTTGTAAGLSATLAIASGGTGATTLAGANLPVTNVANTFTGTQTFSGTSTTLAAILTNAAEKTTISATAATGTIAYYTASQSVLYYTSNASTNWTINIRHSVGTTLNTVMATGQTITITHLVTQGTTAFYNSAVQVDGTTTGVTTKWQGGTAPASGDVSAVDVYTYAVIKTGAATFTVLAAVSVFA